MSILKIMISISIVLVHIPSKAFSKDIDFSFASVGNDSAHIELVFYKNKTFELKFKAIDDFKESNLKGVWVENINVYDFTITDFGEFKKDILNNFFDIPNNKTLTKIHDKEVYRLRVSKNAMAIELWKIKCEKKAYPGIKSSESK